MAEGRVWEADGLTGNKTKETGILQKPKEIQFCSAENRASY